MHFPLVLAVLGRLMITYAGIMTIPLVLALYLHETSLFALIVSVIATVASGLAMVQYGNLHERLGIREGFAIVVGAWLLASVYGALPYWLSDSIPAFIDALFETVSGLTTTGASVIDQLGAVPRSLLLWRSMTHWLGGMGIIVLFIAVLPNIGAGAFHLFRAEVPGPTAERVVPRIKDTALALWLIYSALTAAEILLLMAAGMSFYEAVNHAFSTLATGGFSTYDASIKHFDSLAIELIIILFMILAGGNFAIYFQALHKGVGKLFRDTEFKMYLLIIAVATAAITANLFFTAGEQGDKALRDSLFQVVSIITTTGFVTADFDKWPPLAKMIILLLMFIGGSAGSTAGGIKIARFILLIKQAWAELKKAIHPKIVVSITVDNRNVEPGVMSTVAQFFFIYMLVFGVAVLSMTATGMEPFEAMGAVAATLGNVGPAFGIVGPTSTYSQISDCGKVVLTVCMLLGRLELFTMLVLLRSEFWRSQRNW